MCPSGAAVPSGSVQPLKLGWLFRPSRLRFLCIGLRSALDPAVDRSDTTCSSMVEHWNANPTVEGSNPSTRGSEDLPEVPAVSRL